MGNRSRGLEVRAPQSLDCSGAFQKRISGHAYKWLSFLRTLFEFFCVPESDVFGLATTYAHVG